MIKDNIIARNEIFISRKCLLWLLQLIELRAFCTTETPCISGRPFSSCNLAESDALESGDPATGV